MTTNDRPAFDRYNQPDNGRKKDSMYELEFPGPLSTHGQQESLPMVVALDGYADAGQAINQASTHLLQALDHSPVASFNVDELIDYRSRRPSVTLDHSSVADRESLALTLNLVKDTEDRPFLLLSGPEPDLKWETFSRSVVDLAKRCSVDRVVTLYAAPMTVPHTRPLMISAHASDRSLVKDFHTWEARMIIPGSAALEIELNLKKAGIETVGVTAHVPHYISASDYPEATRALLSAAGKVTEREIPLGALDADIDRMKRQLADQVEENQEIAAIVGALEQQYDLEAERQRKRRENNLLAPGEDIPTGDELGAEFEAFLAEMSTSPGEQAESQGSGGAAEQNDSEQEDSAESTEEDQAWRREEGNEDS